MARGVRNDQRPQPEAELAAIPAHGRRASGDGGLGEPGQSCIVPTQSPVPAATIRDRQASRIRLSRATIPASLTPGPGLSTPAAPGLSLSLGRHAASVCSVRSPAAAPPPAPLSRPTSTASATPPSAAYPAALCLPGTDRPARRRSAWRGVPGRPLFAGGQIARPGGAQHGAYGFRHRLRGGQAVPPREPREEDEGPPRAPPRLRPARSQVLGYQGSRPAPSPSTPSFPRSWSRSA